MSTRREFLTQTTALTAAVAATTLKLAEASNARPPGDRGALMNISQSTLQSSLGDACVRHNVPGASAAVFRDGELLAAATGISNRRTGVELTPETVMHIGSITKVFNTTLAMQLVDDGLVELDQPVLRYLPDLRLGDQRALERMTVKMLINHTAGVDGDLRPVLDHDRQTIEGGVRGYAKAGQLHSPGAEFSYNNAAMVIAGYLVQRLRGKGWYALVRERIFEPLGMQHSATLPEEALLHRASIGHYANPSRPTEPIPASHATSSMSSAPAGSTLMTSARDLVAFACAHMGLGVGLNGARILSERSARAMQSMTVDNTGKGYTFGASIGLGWMLLEGGLLHHSGGGPGIIAALYAHPQHRFAAAILTNAQYGFGMVNELLMPWLDTLGNAKPVGYARIELPSKTPTFDAGRYVGVYESAIFRYRVSRTSSGLAITTQAKFAIWEDTRTEESPPQPLTALGDDKFMMGTKPDPRPSALDGYRLVAFRNANSAGRTQLLGHMGRLYRRTGD